MTDKTIEQSIEKVTRFGLNPGEEDVTIEFYDKEFKVEGTDIAGPILYVGEQSPDPEYVPQGSKLLVNASVTAFDKDGCFVLRTGEQNKFEIAVVEKQEDGTFLYTVEKDKPQVLNDLSEKEFVGRVWEVQTLREIEEIGSANSDKPFDPDAPKKKVRLWFPLWSDGDP